ncbi:hypothetical protein [Sphingomonas paeninsulae]|uniref:hypothetical protein n=1 Tax=Sphingomonas paeninsulae TaxID=2319844 RepID=UPI0013CEF4E6|nr:hypothetical protein [Sphingomonas paeninsulae]
MMFNDPVEAEYYERRLKCSLDMAATSDNAGAVLAHRGLAACYQARLLSLMSADTPFRPGARAALSLDAFRIKKPSAAFPMARSGGGSAARL